MPEFGRVRSKGNLLTMLKKLGGFSLTFIVDPWYKVRLSDAK
jgi:hypothetical protein